MKIRARLRREDGAAAVEFALIVGVLAMLIFGMLQFGLGVLPAPEPSGGDARGCPSGRRRWDGGGHPGAHPKAPRG